jgi:ABC-type transport system substrate-binding protein
MRFAVGDPELDSAFLRDEVDVRVHASITSRDAVAVRDDAVSVRRASRRQRGLGLSLLGRKDGRSVRWVEAFQDDRVRRAISLGLDRPVLLELDDAAMSGPVGPAHAGDALPSAELQAHPLLQRDLEEARTLLAAAGAEGLEFRLQHLDSSGILPLARLVVEQLGEAGFAPRATAMADAEWETSFQRGDFEACIFELEALQTPDLGLRLHTSGGLNGLFSLWGYSNPVYDSAVRDALSELDPVQRAELSHEAQRLLLEDVPAMFPLASPREYATLSPRVRGWEFGAYEFNAAYLSATWTVNDEPVAPPL